MAADGVRLYPEDFWYLVAPNRVPRPRHKYEYYWKLPLKDLEILKHPRIKLLCWDEAVRQREEMRNPGVLSLYNDFNFLRPGYHFDVFLTNRIPMAATMLSSITPWTLGRFSPSFVFCSRNGYVFDQDMLANDIVPWLLYAQCVGWLIGYNIFDAENQLHRAEAVLRSFFKPHVVRQFQERSTFIYSGFNCDQLEEDAKKIEKDPLFSINWSFRTYALYRFEDGLEIINRAYVLSKDKIRVVINSPSGRIRPRSITKEEWDSKYKHFDIKAPCPRDEYVRRAASCHVSLNLAQYAEGSHTTCELLYMGVPVIMRKAPWSQQMLPTWPYKCDSDKEVLQMILWMKDHWKDDSVQDALKDVKKYIRAHYHSPDNNQRTLEWIREKYFAGKKRVKETQWTEILKAAKQGAKFPISFADFAQRITNVMESPWDFNRHALRYPTTEVNRAEWMSRLHQIGLYDDCQEEWPVIREIGS